MRTPRLSGYALLAARIAAETPGTQAGMHEILKRSLGLNQLGKLPAMWRGELPLDAKPHSARAPRRWSDAALAAPPVRAWPNAAAVYARAYRERGVSPRTV